MTKEEIRIAQLEAHDAAGVESDMITDWSFCDDGYGSNVLHGDMSVQRMVERGLRSTNWPNPRPDDVTPQGYDTEPWQSKAQARAMHAHMGEKNGMSESQVKEFDSATDFKHLPEHVKK